MNIRRIYYGASIFVNPTGSNWKKDAAVDPGEGIFRAGYSGGNGL
ncbi:hypothetical protein [Lacrimispora sp. 210928-DFI.3.58]|nr:hypothetical protein [Lacrimispora sp. 210928-DFI.3.58]